MTVKYAIHRLAYDMARAAMEYDAGDVGSAERWEVAAERFSREYFDHVSALEAEVRSLRWEKKNRGTL